MATVESPPHFPDDVLIDIFLRLPVRSLFLFRSVSKHWLKLIQSPNFIKLHRKRPISNTHNPLIVLRTVSSETEPETKKIVLTLMSDDETLAYKDDVALELLSPSMASRPLSLEEGKLRLMGPCNGVFCISDAVDVVVFNPATRQCRKVPRSPLSPRGMDWYNSSVIDHFDCAGFGFDKVSKDYKVVRFHSQDGLDADDNNNTNNDWDNSDADSEVDRDFDDDDDDNDGWGGGYDDDYPRDHRIKVEIFSLSTNCWKEFDCVVRAFDMVTLCSSNMFYNGAFHWLGGEDHEDISSVLVFDLNKKAFKQFSLPESYSENDDYSVQLSVWNKSLAMIVHREDDYLENNVEFEIWVMRKYGVFESWVRLYEVGFDVGIERPLSLGKRSEFLVESCDGKLASFDLKSMTIKEFQVDGVRNSMQAFRYRESFVSLKKSKRKRM